MTRRFDDFTQEVHDWFKQHYDKASDPEQAWVDREEAILNVGSRISPGEATRESQKRSQKSHSALSHEQAVRRGRRYKMIALLSSLYRNDHLDQKVDGNRTFYRYKEKQPGVLSPKRTRVQVEAVQPIVEPVPVKKSFTSTEQVSTFRLMAKSDIGKLPVTDVLVDGQPRIRIELDNMTLELTASAVDSLCDRLASQLIYARGRAIALEQATSL
jgi:hypothetical protein